MPDHYRHTVSELITRYELEPALRDIYVEGYRDQYFLRWFFHYVGKSAVVVYPILDAVERGELLQENGEGGNRARVIDLCVKLSAALSPGVQNVGGVIDKDYWELLGETCECPLLTVTEFSCLECYCLDDETLHKFSNVYLGKGVEVSCYRTMFAVLRQLFLLRAAKISLGKSKWVDGFTKLCSLDGSKIVFEFDEYVKRLVTASEGQLTERSLRRRFGELQDLAADVDFRQFINAHDLVSLLSWYSRNYLRVDAHVSNEQSLQRGLLTSVEGATLKLTRLFGALNKWANVSA